MNLNKWTVGAPLPPEREPFEYEGQTYFWERCNCGNPFCGRPEAFSEPGVPDFPMTVRLRGTNQGMDLENLLVKYYGIERIALAHGMSGENIVEIWLDFVEEIEATGTVNIGALLAKDITEEDYLEAKEEFDEIGNESPFQILTGDDALAALRNILGEDFSNDPGRNSHLN